MANEILGTEYILKILPPFRSVVYSREEDVNISYRPPNLGLKLSIVRVSIFIAVTYGASKFHVKSS